MKKVNISFFLSLIVFIAAGFSLSSCKDTLDMPFEEAVKFNPKDDPYMEVCEHASKVLNTISSNYYDKCSSIEELSEYLDEIKSLEYVEDAYCTNISMFVKIKDFRTVSYSFFPNEDPDPSEAFTQMIEDVKTRAESGNNKMHPLLELKNSILINQQSHDEGRESFKAYYKYTNTILKKYANIDTITNNDPSLAFLQNNLFDYDLVLLITHGSYDPKTHLHWICTGEEVSLVNIDEFLYKKFIKYGKDQVSLMTIKEKRNGKEKAITYMGISEVFISASKKEFKNKGCAIVFNISCQSLMGGEEIEQTDENIRNYSFAEVFIDKGAGIYLGYDESCDKGKVGISLFIQRLLSCLSLDRAYHTLPVQTLHNPGNENIGNKRKPVIREYVADLLYYPGNSLLLDKCIIKPQLTKVFFADNQIVFNAVSLLQEIATYNNMGLELDTKFKDSLLFGFEASEFEDFSKEVIYKHSRIGEAGCVEEGTIVNFCQYFDRIKFKSETTYYFRAYFFDGEEYYYSDIDSFTTPKFDNDNTEDPKDTGDTTNNAQTQDVPGTDL